MSNQKKGFTDEELKMMEEMESIIAEMKKHPEIMNEPLPESLHKELWRDIHEYNEEKAKAVSSVPEKSEPEVPRISDEEQELIQLGKIYKRKKKNRKFYVLIAAVICAMSLGITGMGENERVFERFGFGTSNRDQEHINSKEGVILDTKAAEEEIYQQIEDEYGVFPVKLDYLPEGIEFLESTEFDMVQILQLKYGRVGEINVSYLIRPNYRTSSWGMDIEDSVIKEYIQEVEGIEIKIKKFQVEGTESYRWTAEYEYKDMQYCLVIENMAENEFHEIINNLKFL